MKTAQGARTAARTAGRTAAFGISTGDRSDGTKRAALLLLIGRADVKHRIGHAIEGPQPRPEARRLELVAGAAETRVDPSGQPRPRGVTLW